MTPDECVKRLKSGEKFRLENRPIEYAGDEPLGDEPLFWPFVICLATLFVGVFSGLLIGFATWGI